jgi:DeoR/GlpR family transcriptional regulator of sugar metabolism
MIGTMIGSSRRTIVLADSSKFEHSVLALIATQAHRRPFTEERPSAELAEALQQSDVELVLASD